MEEDTHKPLAGSDNGVQDNPGAKEVAEGGTHDATARFTSHGNLRRLRGLQVSQRVEHTRHVEPPLLAGNDHHQSLRSSGYHLGW